MLAEIASGLNGLKAAMDIAKGLNAAAGEAALKDAKIALQARILEAQAGLLSAQEAQGASQQRVRDLEAELKHLKAWEREKERYFLKEFPTGVFAYALRSDNTTDEPAHYLCPTCYEEGRKAILQTIFRERGGHVVDCYRCKARYELSEAAPEPINYDRGPSYV